MRTSPFRLSGTTLFPSRFILPARNSSILPSCEIQENRRQPSCKNYAPDSLYEHAPSSTNAHRGRKSLTLAPIYNKHGGGSPSTYVFSKKVTTTASEFAVESKIHKIQTLIRKDGTQSESERNITLT